jgi:hypothetical protein
MNYSCTNDWLAKFNLTNVHEGGQKQYPFFHFITQGSVLFTEMLPFNIEISKEGTRFM